MDTENTMWKVVGTGAAVLGATLARNALTAGWRRATDEDPPANPASPTTNWGEAVTWAAITGLVIGVARMIATRGAAEQWRRRTGSLPPGLEEVA